METDNFDKLVKVVTENILGKLDFKSNSKINPKSCLILIPNIGFGVANYFKFITTKYPDYDLYIGAHEEFSKSELIENNKSINFIKFDVLNNEFINLLDVVETIIIIGPKISLLKDIIIANDEKDINHIILGSLMANKKVEILINSNNKLFNKIATVIHEIRNMGIDITNIQYNNDSTLNKVDLITEDYIMDLKEHGLKKITLDRKQLITPLAKDKLREFRINIEYNEEAN